MPSLVGQHSPTRCAQPGLAPHEGLPTAGSGTSVHGAMRKGDRWCDAKRDGGRLGPAQMVRCEKRKMPPTAATLSAATSTTPKRHDTTQHRTSFSGCASSHRSKSAVRGLSTASATAVAPFCPRAPLESSGWAETGCFSMPLLRSSEPPAPRAAEIPRISLAATHPVAPSTARWGITADTI